MNVVKANRKCYQTISDTSGCLQIKLKEKK